MTSELRVRNNSVPDTTDYYVETHWPSGAVYSYAGLVGRYQEEMTDYVTPNFRKIIARGGIVNNPCSYSKKTITTTGGTVGSHQNASATQGWTSVGFATAALKPSNIDVLWPQIAWQEPSGLKSEARMKLEAIARVDSSQYSFGEDSAELKETLRFLRHPVDSLLGLTRQHQLLLRKIHRRNNYAKRYPQFDKKLSTASRMKQNWRTYNGNARSIAKAYADVWSAYSFAAAPLYRSANDALEAWYTLPSKIHVLGRKTSHSRSSDTWEGSWSSLAHVVNAYVTRYYSVSRRLTKSRHVSILYEVRNPIKTIHDDIGFRPKDFPVTMWQIMPLSFMIDRIYDVSSLLKATINIGDPKVKILTGSVTERTEYFSSIQLTSVAATLWPGNTVGEVVEDKQFSYKRTPWTPSISDAVPGWDASQLIADATRIADTLAIVTKMLL